MAKAAFTYAANPARILFGPGRLAELGIELDRLGCRSALILSTPEQAGLAEAVAVRLGAVAASVYAGAAMHTPVAVTEDALLHLRRLGCDSLVTIGGGSTIGLGKALALRTGLPQIAIPTTYAGSEMTPILGETIDGRKTTQCSSMLLPAVVIYDVELTLTLPSMLSVVSGFNAIAHAVEALYARDANPVVSLMAEEAISALAQGLPGVVKDRADLSARGDAQYGAWLAGACLGAVGMALHHKICHVLGGTFDLRHAETHTVMLPHVMAYNAAAAPDAMRRVARALGRADAASSLFALARSLGAPASLRELGMPEDGIDQSVQQVMQDQYWNPRAPEAASLRGMVARAWVGAPPHEDRAEKEEGCHA